MQNEPAGGAPLDRGVRPCAWTLQSELDARETTCKAHLWFVNPVNTSWAPLYDRDTIDRLNSDRLDMALMVYRLIRRMRAAREGRGHAAGDEALAAKALDYLQRKGLQASPLRADAGPNAGVEPHLPKQEQR